MTEPHWDDHPNFTRDEFVCKCGCDRADMDHGFMVWLQMLRTAAGFPFIVTSGFRCPEHNIEVSSSGFDGPHTTGKAVDISVNRKRAHGLSKRAFEIGVMGYGVAQKGWGRFIHLDLCEEPDAVPRPTIWSY